jgi:hypothetical protein
MRLSFLFIGVILSIYVVDAFSSENVARNIVAPTGLLITGVGIGTVWTLDLISQKNINLNGNIFRARDKGTNQVMWPHLLAEYGTAACAVVSAIGLYNNKPWANSMALVTSGLITYTSINSMAWVVSEKGRFSYAIPMMIGLASAGISIAATF